MKKINIIKETGSTFTPKKLADFLTDRLLSYNENRKPLIVDPSCGDGALLTSIGEKLDKQNIKYSILGYDINFDYLSKARKKLKDKICSNFYLKNEDFLEKIDIESEKNYIHENKFADIIIANPPYVRTQILGAKKAQFLAKKYKLMGRVDLYYPFLIAMTSALKEGGLIGVITSNKFLFTKSGNSIRKFLFENFEILEVIDLGDTKLFDAAVLPAIFIGRKKNNSPNDNVKFQKIYEENEYTGHFINSVDVFDILNSKDSGYFSDGVKIYKKSYGIVKFPKSKENNWLMLSEKEEKWVKQIENNSFEKICDSFKVRVGIKTTADKIFISDSWDELNCRKPEDENLKYLLSQENIKPWGLDENKKLKVLYPYTYENGLKKLLDIEMYPKTKKYLEDNSEILKGRKYLTDSGREWYEIWVTQNPFLWKFPKLVFPDISSVPRFYFDDSGKIVNGNCYWIVANDKKDIDKLLLIQGISNSKLMTKYHDLVFGNMLYSGRRRYFSQYVKNYPLPNIESKESSDIIRLVKKINNTSDEYEIKELVKKLEFFVTKAYGF